MSIRILQGDVRERLAGLPDDSFDCIVTSPPYWGLRDYGVVGQIGLEPTLTEYLDAMVDVCRELRRVLKPSGTFWLNVGDSYAATGARSNNNGSGATGLKRDGRNEESRLASAAKTKTLGMKLPPVDHGLAPKQLCMVPNRLAIRLQEDGWYVRSEIIWHKPNPMPESVTDRPTSSHEKIWLLTKSERYAYDADAIREPESPGTASFRAMRERFKSNPDRHNAIVESSMAARTDGVNNRRTMLGLWGANNDPGDFKRNSRNVWTIASQPYSEAHFATFPPELAERCIKAGCPSQGHVLDPFGGAGTTGLVADRLGRDATLIELNPAYVSLIKNRIAEDAGMFAQVAAE
jgi:DNA modification methylase